GGGSPADPRVLRRSGPRDRQPGRAAAAAAETGPAGHRPAALVAGGSGCRRARISRQCARPVPATGVASMSRPNPSRTSPGRTSPSRRGVLDAVVVGAGVVGTAAALGLARQGLQVALVEGREPM